MSKLTESRPVHTDHIEKENQVSLDATINAPSHELARLMRLATYVAISVASFLVISKFVAWMATESVSLLSTLIDSILDVAASAINLIAVRHALEPADHEHRFGHGKAESLAGLAQSAFIFGSALFLLFEASQRFFKPRNIENTDIGLYVMGISIVLTIILVGFLRYVISRTKSVAIGADSLHYQMDILVNLGVILSLLAVSLLDWKWADPTIAVFIAIYIVRGAWEIAQGALDVLMDRELSEDERKTIRNIALQHSEVRGVHDLRTRSSGHKIFIQLHLELDPTMALSRSHELAEAVEFNIMEVFPNSEVLVHQDPEGVTEHVPVFRNT